MNYEYPETTDPDFLSKIYRKREFYFQKIAPRFKPYTQEEINEYRNNVCGSDFKLQSYQTFLANFINPYTPYRGIIIFHGTGSGKTCGAIAIAEQFKEQVEKYNTKIYVLCPGPILKEQFKSELITVCTNYSYITNKEEFKYASQEEQAKAKKDALYATMKYYTIISYKNFHRRVLGEKLKETVITTGKKKTVYKTNEEGDIERERSLNKIESLDNTVLIIDEAHNFTNNEYGEALTHILKKSKNLRVVLLTATPMKNLADDIIPLLNFVRPLNDPIQRNRVFEGNDYEMKLSEEGRTYLSQMATGYISYYKGNNPFTFAEKVEMGEIPEELLFTPLIRCQMSNFHLKAYQSVVSEIKDALDKVSESVSNFVFPGVDIKTKEVTAFYGEQGYERLKSQLNEIQFLDLINEKFFNNEVESREIMYLSKANQISGKIFHEKYLKQFSPKFYKCLQNINKLEGIGFIYSNLVHIGVKLFEEILLENGYLEYQENGNYTYNQDTRHYKYDIRYKEFQEKFKGEKFIPATFITITGGIEDGMDIPQEKLNTIRSVFNNINNQDGRFIKLLLGSKVVNEGVTLENIKEIHILDVHYHLGRVDQIIGRGIRHCKHYKSISAENLNPQVKIYKYVVSVPKGLSKEEELYRKAELKYINIKEVERLLIEISVDCPINFAANQLVEDLVKYKDCQSIDKVMKDKSKKAMLCPVRCEFQDCKFKCGSKTLNLEYYDQTRNIYKNLNKSHLDYGTFNKTLARSEINFAKSIIKDHYRLRDYYNIKELERIIQSKYPEEKRDLFDIFFVYRALDELLPGSEEELQNFEDYVYNKYNVQGYLVYKDKFYIFQPLGEKTDITLDYRSSFNTNLSHNIYLDEFVKGTYKTLPTSSDFKTKLVYDFESNQDYYDSREENEFVGIIDKPPNAKHLLKIKSQINDVFKLRPKRNNKNIKKREIGLPSIKGATCLTAKDKNQLIKIAKSLGIGLNPTQKNSRESLCSLIKKTLIYMEKYAGSRTGIPKKTYLIIPVDHPIFVFPLNIEDRIDFIEKISQVKLDVKPLKTGFEVSSKILPKDVAKKYGFEKVNDKYVATFS